jgi:hypothetical protein
MWVRKRKAEPVLSEPRRAAPVKPVATPQERAERAEVREQAAAAKYMAAVAHTAKLTGGAYFPGDVLVYPPRSTVAPMRSPFTGRAIVEWRRPFPSHDVADDEDEPAR